MVKRFLIYLSFSIVLLSCQDDDIIHVPPQLVVEGWIDADGFPIVILTTTVPINDDKQSVTTLDEYMVKWAKVTISDGEQEAVLIGKVNNDYFPPYIYTTSHMRGVPGKNYKLVVEYKDFYAKAVATIPYKVNIDSFSINKIGGGSDYYALTAHFKDNPDEKNYYKFFTYSSSSEYKSYSSARLSLVNDEVIDGIVSVPIYRDRGITNWEDYEENFLLGEKVKVKFAQIDSTGFYFWKSYEDVYTLSRNPLFPATSGLKSNVNGALGYWLGYGAKEYVIEIK